MRPTRLTVCSLLTFLSGAALCPAAEEEGQALLQTAHEQVQQGLITEAVHTYQQVLAGMTEARNEYCQVAEDAAWRLLAVKQEKEAMGMCDAGLQRMTVRRTVLELDQLSTDVRVNLLMVKIHAAIAAEDLAIARQAIDLVLRQHPETQEAADCIVLRAQLDHGDVAAAERMAADNQRAQASLDLGGINIVSGKPEVLRTYPAALSEAAQRYSHTPHYLRLMRKQAMIYGQIYDGPAQVDCYRKVLERLPNPLDSRIGWDVLTQTVMGWAVVIEHGPVKPGDTAELRRLATMLFNYLDPRISEVHRMERAPDVTLLARSEYAIMMAYNTDRNHAEVVKAAEKIISRYCERGSMRYTFARCHLHAGICLERMNEKDRAMAHYEEVLRMNKMEPMPNTETVPKAAARLAKMGKVWTSNPLKER